MLCSVVMATVDLVKSRVEERWSVVTTSVPQCATADPATLVP